MSEYQYYEFEAVDRPLTAEEMRELRAVSTRAEITPRRFTNHYEWGDLKADPRDWVERYFDAFLYLANWGTRRLMLRFPWRVLDPATARLYCRGEAAEARVVGEHVILEFTSEDEEGDEDWWVEEEEDELSSILPVRADIAGGDLRTLYLGWLLCVQEGELDDDEVEPPCPPGLRRLSAPLEAFATFLRVDRDLLEAAAAGSAEAEETYPTEEVSRWVAALPDGDKDALLVRLIEGEQHLRAELVRRFRESRTTRDTGTTAHRRTVGDLLAEAGRRTGERQGLNAERAAAERARKEREAAEARERHIAEVAGREADAWREVEALIATKQPKRYDAAVALLADLREVALRAGRRDEAGDRIRDLLGRHARKATLIDRLRAAGLIGSAAAEG